MDTKTVFNKYFNSGRLSHAYIISGAGDEKDGAAAAFAAAAVCSGENPPCGVCVHCRKVRDGIHPDVIFVEPEKDKSEIYVRRIREITADAVVLPNEAERKVYIIKPAEAMNPPAQNALLKVLEEPPSYCTFLLLTENSGALLPTVRSRCAEIRITESHEEEDDGEGSELLDVLTGSDREAKLRACFDMEKLTRAEFQSLADKLRRSTAKRLRTAASCGRDREASELFDILKILDELDEYSVYNVGVGHMAGLILSHVV